MGSSLASLTPDEETPKHEQFSLLEKNLNAESLARIGNRKTRVVTHTSKEDRGGNKSIFCIFAEKCTACLKPLEEDGVFALGQLYHKACFR